MLLSRDDDADSAEDGCLLPGLEEVMRDDSTVYGIMKRELHELRNKHGVPRRSIIKADEGSLSDIDLLANDR